MEISARSYLTAGMSLTAATAIALTPLAIPPAEVALPVPSMSTADVELTVTPADIVAAVAALQGVLDDGTDGATYLSGIPIQLLISGVVDNITTALDVGFSTAIALTPDPTLAESLTILKTLSVDAYEKLAENLGLINDVVTSTTAEVGDLLTTALTGSLQNLLVAAVAVINDPLDPQSYVGLLTAGVASAQLVATNGLEAVQALGDGGFEILDIARQEVTFQFNNATTRLGDVLTQLADATGDPVVEQVVAAVRVLGIGSAQAVFNFGSESLGAVIATANDGFDDVIDGATDVVSADVTADAVSTAYADTEESRVEESSVEADSADEAPGPQLRLAVATESADDESDAAVDEVTESDDAIESEDAIESADSIESEDAIESADSIESEDAIESEDEQVADETEDDDTESAADEPTDSDDDTDRQTRADDTSDTE